MAQRLDRNLGIDLFFVGLALVILVLVGWTWITVFPLAQQFVLFVIGVTLVVSVLFLIGALLLVVVRLRARIVHLEDIMSQQRNDNALTSRTSVQVITLSNVERRILNRLEEEGGSVVQDQLRRITGLSKSTLSVTLTNLERKALIRRRNFGRTKLIELIQKVRR